MAPFCTVFVGTSSGGRTRVGRPIFRVGRAEMVYCGQVIVVYCHGLQERRPTAGSAGVADFSLIDVFFFRVFAP